MVELFWSAESDLSTVVYEFFQKRFVLAVPVEAVNVLVPLNRVSIALAPTLAIG